MEINRFWHWFEQNADLIARCYDNEAVISELDEQVTSSWPELSWEIGPEPAGGWYFALSPNLDKNLAVFAKQKIDLAPKIPGWTFYPAKQRKIWNGNFSLYSTQGCVEIDASNWEYVLLRYPDGECEILLIGSLSNALGADDHLQAAATVIQSLIGEKYILDNSLSFALESDLPSQFLGKQKPVQDLPKAFGMSLLTH